MTEIRGEADVRSISAAIGTEEPTARRLVRAAIRSQVDVQELAWISSIVWAKVRLLREGSEEVVSAFSRCGLSVVQLPGNDCGLHLIRIAVSLNAIPDASMRSVCALELAGRRRGRELLLIAANLEP